MDRKERQLFFILIDICLLSIWQKYSKRLQSASYDQPIRRGPTVYPGLSGSSLV